EGQAARPVLLHPLRPHRPGPGQAQLRRLQPAPARGGLRGAPLPRRGHPRAAQRLPDGGAGPLPERGVRRAARRQRMATPPDLSVAILAGGLGTRLRPAVADRPKVLAPVAGRPYLTYLLDQLDGAGVREAVLLTGYAAGQVRGALGDRYGGLRLHYSVEPEPLGTAGALRLALPRLTA